MKTAERRTREPTAIQNGRVAGGGTRVFVNEMELHVPGWVVDIESFRKWTDTEEFPDHGHVWWLRGEVWADMSKEQIFSHLAIKQEFGRVLGNLAVGDCPGMLIPDGLLLSNFAADISGNPDATFISNSTFDSERVRLIEGANGGFVEVQGSPDMVLEVISDSSVKKDTETLFDAYWKAGVTEYWVVDARQHAVQFDIFRHSAKGYRRVAKKEGWLASNVFGKSFRLTVAKRKTGHPKYTLEVR
jgi:Uma2 family endonuclease